MGMFFCIVLMGTVFSTFSMETEDLKDEKVLFEVTFENDMSYDSTDIDPLMWTICTQKKHAPYLEKQAKKICKKNKQQGYDSTNYYIHDLGLFLPYTSAELIKRQLADNGMIKALKVIIKHERQEYIDKAFVHKWQQLRDELSENQRQKEVVLGYDFWEDKLKNTNFNVFKENARANEFRMKRLKRYVKNNIENVPSHILHDADLLHDIMCMQKREWDSCFCDNKKDSA